MFSVGYIEKLDTELTQIAKGHGLKRLVWAKGNSLYDISKSFEHKTNGNIYMFLARDMIELRLNLTNKPCVQQEIYFFSKDVKEGKSTLDEIKERFAVMFADYVEQLTKGGK